MKTMTLAALVLILAGVQATRADDAEERHATIQAFYPLMIQAVGNGQFGQARGLCQKAIEWEPREPVHYYNLACIESRAGDAIAAFDALQEAVLLGYANADSMQTDPDLATVRQNPGFAGLLASVGKKPPGPNDGLPPLVPPAPPPPGTPPAPLPNPGPQGLLVSPPVLDDTPVAPVQNPPADMGAETLPEKAAITARGPVGLYFMTRYWSFTQTLEKAVWYFAPDGRVYQNLTDGFSAADLAAHKGPKGTLQLSGNKMSILWSDGKTENSEFERDNGNAVAFMWQMGSFVPADPFGDARSLVGRWDGGESLIVGANKVRNAQLLVLNADGTYSWEGAAIVSGGELDDGIQGSAQTTTPLTGTWKLGTYSLTLTGGKTMRRIAFPYNTDDNAAVKPDHLFFGGTMFKRL
jgi:hypothetical protein